MSVLNRAALLGLALCSASPLAAQLTAPVKNGDNSIVVTGTKTGKSRHQVEMSDWKMAETAHVVVFSKGDEKALVRTADNLEKLHFLLSMLLGRVDQPDDTIKVAVTMIGDAADFEQLRLTNLRWQYGPFPETFPKTIYYDPREEGSVLATTRNGVRIILQPSQGRPTSRDCDTEETFASRVGSVVVSPPPPQPPSGGPTSEGTVDPSQFPVGEIAFCQSAEARLYSAFAQNYLMTHFPAAYPRWYLQGFGEMFSTMTAGNGVIEYGRAPIGFQAVLERYGNYPVTDILSGGYLGEQKWPRLWTPYHAWRLVHMLFFSEEWRQPLHNYLRAATNGADPAIAARALGDPKALQKAVSAYRRKVPFEQLTYPADRVKAPIVRRLTRAEAGLVRGRLELGARVELPAEGSRDRPAALARREAWLARLRDNATKFPNLIENQLLLAEGECRSGNAEACLQAAERALAIGPSDTTGMVWKGTAMLQLAAGAPAAERASRIKAARAVIAKANRADPDAILPLIAYSNSYAAVGQPAPDVAVDALFSIVDSAPAAPKPRLMLGEELVRRDLDAEARKILLPVAKGAFETPEKPRAEAILPNAELPSAR
jgi:hypothetical protein